MERRGGEERREEERREKIFEEIMAKNFLILKKNIHLQIQRTPSRINLKRPTLRHIITKLPKVTKGES